MTALEQTPLSKDTIDFVLRHGEVGRAKDLPAPPHISSSWCAQCLGLYTDTIQRPPQMRVWVAPGKTKDETQLFL